VETLNATAAEFRIDVLVRLAYCPIPGGQVLVPPRFVILSCDGEPDPSMVWEGPRARTR